MTVPAKARYCSPCSENWPDALAYYKCPGCGEATEILPMEPMEPRIAFQRAADMALARDRHAKFEAFCAERDKPIIDAEVEKFRAVLDALPGAPV